MWCVCMVQTLATFLIDHSLQLIKAVVTLHGAEKFSVFSVTPQLIHSYDVNVTAAIVQS